MSAQVETVLCTMSNFTFVFFIDRLKSPYKMRLKSYERNVKMSNICLDILMILRTSINVGNLLRKNKLEI